MFDKPSDENLFWVCLWAFIATLLFVTIGDIVYGQPEEEVISVCHTITDPVERDHCLFDLD